MPLLDIYNESVSISHSPAVFHPAFNSIVRASARTPDCEHHYRPPARTGRARNDAGLRRRTSNINYSYPAPDMPAPLLSVKNLSKTFSR